MEESKTYTTATEHVSIPTYRPRQMPDVPEDVDFLMEHLNDPNYDLKKPHHVRSEGELGPKATKTSYEHSEDAESHYESDRYSTSRAESRNSTSIEFDDESPYPEVRAAVASVDDPLMPVNTFRMWFLGLFFTIAVSGTNQLFSLRYPSVFVTGIVAQLLSLPLGKGLEKILPTTKFNTFGYVWSFNPGPFSIKEHVCITVMANVVVAGAYATDILLSQRIFYGQTLTYSYQILLVLSTQVIGFSFGGFLRQFVVWPSSMIWPGALVNAALFNTLHKNFGKGDRGHMSREKFFFIALAASFFWFWIPGYLFTALSVFNWVCWIAPNNLAVNTLFGTSTGLGMGILTFDWSMISFIGSPLVTPWWSQMNTVVGFIVIFWVIAPIIYFTNTWDTAFLPVSSYFSFDNTGNRYDIRAILSPDGLFDQEAYAAYSPLLMPATLALAYGVAFAAFISVFIHTILWFRRDIVRRFRSTLKDERDVHSRLMLAYPEVPWYWYTIVFAISFIFLMVAVSIFPTQLPAWAALIGIIISAAMAIPVAMLQAITNQQVPTQVMYELIIGYILPGRPIANMIFKVIGYIGTAQAVTFSGDMKLGHYMKVPPRMMFAVQLVAAIVSCFVVIFVQDWMLNNIEDVCTRDQANGFICPSSTTFATASLIWGGIGPQRLFSPGAPYSALCWFFAVGGLLPLPFYLLARRYPLSFWRYINVPVGLAGLGALPPATGINYASWAIVGFIFNYFIRRYHFRWWMRYNYILSAALDAGVVIALIVIFFAIQYPTGIEIEWWGNTVWINTADTLGIPLRTLGPEDTIGPKVWS
ncbi:Glutathione transporter 1 [Hypsizygus marmoreus]|uniref:Glutathione transporter 1 n=1 Tax=Hypsizygus marmoreus TaxID=39966 RepID=A0A369K654_HYPMA|nr:Glutathione transporter 1 [Hypsizygus marmoreus]